MAKKPPASDSDLTIEFTSVPAFGSYLNLKGVVHHVEPERVRLAVYIRVDGGWWNKPTWEAPASPLAADGSFSVDITTGGSDERATEIAAFLIPSDYYPPGMRGEPTFPEELGDKALASITVLRTP